MYKTAIAAAVLLIALAVLLFRRSGESTSVDVPAASKGHAGRSVEPLEDVLRREMEEVSQRAFAGEEPAGEEPAAQATSSSGAKAAPGDEPLEEASALGRIRVEVTEGASGKPARGAVVEVLDHTAFRSGMTWSGIRQAATADDGAAIFDGLNPGQASVILLSLGAGGVPRSGDVTVRAAETVTISFVVDASQNVKGRVMSESGERLVGAKVWNFGDGQVGAVVATSGVDGAFEVPYAQAPLQLVATHDGYGSSDPVVWGVGEARDGAVTITLSSRRGRVFGRALGADGAPVLGAHILLGAQDQRRLAKTFGRRSLEDGSFEFSDVGVGDYFLDARVPGGALERQLLSVTDGGQHEVTVQLRQGGTVSGRLTKPDGTAWVGCSVTPVESRYSVLVQTNATTDESGQFSLLGQEPGEVRYVVYDAQSTEIGGAMLSVIEGAVTEWNPVIPVREPLHGTVRSSGGRLLARWKVHGQPYLGPEPYASWRSKSTDEAGQFRVMPSLGDSYRLRVYAPGASGDDFALEVAPVDPSSAPFDLVVPRAGVPQASVVGRVVDRSGAPLRGKRVTLIVDRKEGQDRYLRGTSGSDGRIEFPFVPPGMGRLVAGYGRAQDPVLLEGVELPRDGLHSVGDLVLDTPAGGGD